jgi:hypothetical protein
MESKLADDLSRRLLDEQRALSREERLVAFLNHCRLMAQLHEAGERIRESTGRPGK